MPRHSADARAQPVDVDVEREPRALDARADASAPRACRHAASAKSPDFCSSASLSCGSSCRRDAAAIAHARSNVPTGGHDQPLHGREAHRGVDGPPAQHGRDRRAGAQVARDRAQKRLRAAEDLRRAPRRVCVGEAMEPISADAVVGSQSSGMAYVEPQRASVSGRPCRSTPPLGSRSNARTGDAHERRRMCSGAISVIDTSRRQPRGDADRSRVAGPPCTTRWPTASTPSISRTALSSSRLEAAACGVELVVGNRRAVVIDKAHLQRARACVDYKDAQAILSTAKTSS